MEGFVFAVRALANITAGQRANTTGELPHASRIGSARRLSARTD
jgi:hypothetical protein